MGAAEPSEPPGVAGPSGPSGAAGAAGVAWRAFRKGLVEKIFCWLFVCLLLISYFCDMEPKSARQGEIRIVYKSPHFEAFYEALPTKVQIKFDYVMEVVTTIYDISTKFIKHLNGTDLYEMRVSVGSNEYRTILFAIDKENVIESTRIILLNGFLKKSNKVYRKQIEIAQSILKELEQ